MTRTALWFDTDPGVDDALALALIARSPALELVGLSTVFGNAALATTTANALRLSALLDLDVPVHAGAEAPLQGRARLAPEVHGGDGLGGLSAELPPPRRATEALAAAPALVQAARRQPGLQVVAVGPLTNIAQALRLDPDLPQRLGGLTVMGGAFGLQGHAGNVSPCAEANIHNDARAAAEVFAAPWRQLRVVGLDATHAVRLDAAALAPLAGAGANARWLWRLVQPYVAYYGTVYGRPMLVAHDATALLPLLDPDALAWRRGPLRVVEGGLAHGQTVQDWQGLGDAAWRALPAHEVAIGADAARVARHCLDAWLRA